MTGADDPVHATPDEQEAAPIEPRAVASPVAGPEPDDAAIDGPRLMGQSAFRSWPES